MNDKALVSNRLVGPSTLPPVRWFATLKQGDHPKVLGAHDQAHAPVPQPAIGGACGRVAIVIQEVLGWATNLQLCGYGCFGC